MTKSHEEPDYPVLIYWSDEDECFIATIPDLEPCSGHGDSPEEALARVLDAKRGWLDFARQHGDPIPAPTIPPRLVRAPA